MQLAYGATDAKRTSLALPATVFLHLLLAWLLYGATQHSTVRQTLDNAMTMLLLPLQRTEPALEETHTRAPRHRKQDSAPAVQPDKSVQPALAPAAAPVQEQHLNIDAVIENSRGDLGRIDRDWRKEHPKLLEAPPNSVQSRLEKGIAAAGKATTTRMETIQLPDGRMMTKVIGPNGTYCAFTRSVGELDGTDHIQQGMKTKVTNCPQ